MALCDKFTVDVCGRKCIFGAPEEHVGLDDSTMSQGSIMWNISAYLEILAPQPSNTPDSCEFSSIATRSDHRQLSDHSTLTGPFTKGTMGSAWVEALSEARLGRRRRSLYAGPPQKGRGP